MMFNLDEFDPVCAGDDLPSGKLFEGRDRLVDGDIFRNDERPVDRAIRRLKRKETSSF